MQGICFLRVLYESFVTSHENKVVNQTSYELLVDNYFHICINLLTSLQTMLANKFASVFLLLERRAQGLNLAITCLT